MRAKELKAYLAKDGDRILKVLEFYNFHSIWFSSGDEIRCAAPKGDNRTAVSIKIEEGLLASYYGGASPYYGDLLGLIMELSGRTFREVIATIHTLFGLETTIKGKKYQRKVDLLKDVRKYKPRKSRDKIKQNTLYDESRLNEFVRLPHEEIIQAGVTPKVCEQFSICFDPRKERIIFPHYDWLQHDKIVGLKGRIAGLTTEQANLLDIPKYWNYIKGYRKTLNLYGWPQASKNSRESKKLILFEGEKSVLKHFSYLNGNGYSVALGGHAISNEQVKFILRNTEPDCEIIIAFDKDIMMFEQNAKEKKEKVLTNSCKQFLNLRKVSYIFDKIDNGKILKDKDAPIDNGWKVFNYLMSERITL